MIYRGENVHIRSNKMISTRHKQRSVRSALLRIFCVFVVAVSLILPSSLGTYLANATDNISITSVTPSSGPYLGGETVTINGTGFYGNDLQVGAGNNFSCELAFDGKAYCWGNNDNGQLGNGSTNDTLTPTVVTMPSGVTFASITVGGNSVCALDTNGKAYCWGANAFGNLGNDSTDNTLIPTAVSMPNGVIFKSISVTYANTCAIGSNNKAYCWGANTSGQLGNGSTSANHILTPAVVTLPSGVIFTKISAGENYTCAIGSNGVAYCWGINTSGQLGYGTTNNVYVPTPVTMPSGVAFTNITASGDHTCAIGSDNKAYCWGKNNSGQLGNGSTHGAPIPTAVSMPNGVTFTKITTGYNKYTCAIGSDNKTYCWGNISDGQLGNGLPNNILVPTTVLTPENVTFTSVSAGYDHTCAVGSDNKAYCWGYGAYNQTYTGYSSILVPTVVDMPSSVSFTKVVAGYQSSCATSSDNKTYCWGDNSNGQLGNGMIGNTYTPTAVVMPSGVTFSDAIFGTSNSCAIGSDNKTYCWGNYPGNGSTDNALVPTAVSMPSGVTTKDLFVFNNYSCAIGSDNKAYCWGDNGDGILGNGSTDGVLVSTAVTMPDGVTFTKIAGGTNSACAIDSNGGAYCWGLNNSGQLGNGSTDDALVPTAVSMPSGVTTKDVFVFYDYACAVGSDNKIYCWGLNNSGQLGNGSTDDSLVPVAATMPDGVTFTKIVGNDAGITLCALGSDSKAYCWGYGNPNQIGNGPTDAALIPTAATMPGGVTFTDITVTPYYVCALGSDSKAYCWGDNSTGALGNGSKDDSPIPTAVTMPDGVTFSSVDGVYDHVCALGSDSKAYCWGNNYCSQLGYRITNDTKLLPSVVTGQPQPTISISFGDVSATQVSIISSSSLRVVVPPHAPGAVTVKIISPTGQAVSYSNYTYTNSMAADTILSSTISGSSLRTYSTAATVGSGAITEKTSSNTNSSTSNSESELNVTNNDDNDNKTNDNNTKKDDNYAWLWIIAALAVIGIVIILLVKKRRAESDL